MKLSQWTCQIQLSNWFNKLFIFPYLFFNIIRYTRKVDEELRQVINDAIEGIGIAIL